MVVEIIVTSLTFAYKKSSKYVSPLVLNFCIFRVTYKLKSVIFIAQLRLFNSIVLCLKILTVCVQKWEATAGTICSWVIFSMHFQNQNQNNCNLRTFFHLINVWAFSIELYHFCSFSHFYPLNFIKNQNERCLLFPKTVRYKLILSMDIEILNDFEYVYQKQRRFIQQILM